MANDYRVKVVNRRTGQHMYNFGGMGEGDRPRYMSRAEALAAASRFNRSKSQRGSGKAVVVKKRTIKKKAAPKRQPSRQPSFSWGF